MPSICVLSQSVVLLAATSLSFASECVVQPGSTLRIVLPPGTKRPSKPGAVLSGSLARPVYSGTCQAIPQGVQGSRSRRPSRAPRDRADRVRGAQATRGSIGKAEIPDSAVGRDRRSRSCLNTAYPPFPAHGKTQVSHCLSQAAESGAQSCAPAASGATFERAGHCGCGSLGEQRDHASRNQRAG